MNKFILLAAFTLLSVFAFAQRTTLSATVIDSATNKPLEHATISVSNLTDSSLVAYTITQKTGVFKLTGIPLKGTKLLITHVGYNSFRKVLSLKAIAENDLGKIELSGQSLDEIKIRAERPPIVIRKDTIEFNTEAFKTRPNAVVEDLLRLLPGVQVNYDGSLTIQGKPVSKLKIDNKLFFGNDPRVASKNLDADMIDKVQIYDDREDDPDHKLRDDEVGKIINLKMKNKIKKSTLGKVYAGKGTRDRYEAGGIISTFRDTLQVSLIGVMNNLSKTGFSYSELANMGGFDRSGNNPAYDGAVGRGWGGGIESIASSGLNINNDYGDKLKMNLTYFYSNNNVVYNGKYLNDQILDNTVLTNNGQSTSTQNEQKHAVSGSLRWKPDTLLQVTYEPRFDINKNYSTHLGSGLSFNTQTPRLTESLNNGVNSSNAVNFSHNFNYYRRFKRQGRSITINNSISLNDRSGNSFSFSDINSFTPNIPDSTLDRYNKRPSLNSNLGVSFNYFHQLVKDRLSMDLYTNSRYVTTAETNLVYDRDLNTLLYDRYQANQSSDVKRTNYIQNFKGQLRFQLKKFDFRFALDVEYQDVNNMFNNATVADMRKQYWYLFPSVNLSYDRFTISYSQYANLPSIYQIQPVTQRYPMSSTSGNPDLLPGKVHQANFYYYKYDHGKQLSTNFNGGFTMYERSVIQIRTVDTLGYSTSTYANRRGSITARLSGSFSKQFKKTNKWQVGVSSYLSGYYNRSAFFLNNKEGIQNMYTLSAAPTVNFNYNSRVRFSTNYRLSSNITQYEEINAKAINTLRHSVGTDLNVQWPAHMIFDVNYNYNYNPQIAPGLRKSSHILNLAATLLMLKKDRGQLKLQVYDVLDQNISVYRYASANAITNSENEILRRYFMLTYQLKLNSFK